MTTFEIPHEETRHEYPIVHAESRSPSVRGLLRKHPAQRVLSAGNQSGLLWAITPSHHLWLPAQRGHTAVAS